MNICRRLFFYSNLLVPLLIAAVSLGVWQCWNLLSVLCPTQLDEPTVAKTIFLPDLGMRIPVVGLGTWKTSAKTVRQAVSAAIAVGYRHFDCAHVYKNEEDIGAVLKEHLDAAKVHRSDLFITSKLWNTFHRPELVLPGVQKSLEHLRLNYVDLYLVHWPISYQPGDETHPKDSEGNMLHDYTHYLDTWKAMEMLVDRGLARAIGLSNFNRTQLADVLHHARIKPAVLQIESHPLLVQEDLVSFAQSEGLVVTAYSPLAQGGEDRPGRPANVLQHPTVLSLAEKHRVSPAQILLRFQLQRGVIVIPKSTNPAHIATNFKVFDFSLSDEEIAALKALDAGWRSVSMNRDRHHPHFPF